MLKYLIITIISLCSTIVQESKLDFSYLSGWHFLPQAINISKFRETLDALLNVIILILIL